MSSHAVTVGVPKRGQWTGRLGPGSWESSCGKRVTLTGQAPGSWPVVRAERRKFVLPVPRLRQEEQGSE